MEETFFVGIYDPVDVRRNLLENSKEIIKSLQSFDNLVKIRQQKIHTYHEMKSLMKELDMLVSKLREGLPKAQLRKAVEKKPAVRIKHASKEEFVSELKKLETEMRKIEQELLSAGKYK